MPITISTSEEAQSLQESIGWKCKIKNAQYNSKNFYKVQSPHINKNSPVYFTKCFNVSKDIENLKQRDYLDDCESIDSYISCIENIEGSQIIDFRFNYSGYDGNTTSIEFVAPLMGYVKIIPLNYVSADVMIKKTARETRQDAEGRSLTELAAMIIAVEAKSLQDVDMLVDAIFMAGDLRYRGLRAELDRDGHIQLSYTHEGVELRHDGIEVPGLPETVRAALKGHQRRRLKQVIEIPGFEDLEIDNILYNAKSRNSRPGENWIRIDVRNEYGAKFAKVEIDEAREIARQTYSKRQEAKQNET